MARGDLLTNHGRVLLLIADDPNIRHTRIAELTGITKRSVARIVDDLEARGYLTKEGRPNLRSYRVHLDAELQDRFVNGTLSDLLSALR